MKSREEHINEMDCSASTTIATSASIKPSGIDPEGMRSAIDRIEVRLREGKYMG
jgi:hypothetical protein